MRYGVQCPKGFRLPQEERCTPYTAVPLVCLEEIPFVLNYYGISTLLYQPDLVVYYRILNVSQCY